MEGKVLVFTSIEASFVKMFEVCGAKGAFMCPPIVIGAGANGVYKDLVSIAMLKFFKPINFLARRKRA